MQSWDGLALGLLALGYRRIHFIEIECGDHGAFRAGVAELLDAFTCPRCGKSAETGYLARGFTRKPSVEWELVSSALSANAKGEWREPAAPRKHQPDHYKPRSGRPTRREAEQARPQIGRGMDSSIGNLAATQPGA